MNKNNKYNMAKEAFDKYYKTFENNGKYKQKYNHSQIVAELMTDLAEKLNLTEEHILLARIIGLLHDIGRFEQIKQTDSYSDKLFDHANYSVEYLFKEKNIRNFIESEENDELIALAILYHNKLTIPNNLTTIEELFCKMLRDCDKIDVIKQRALEENSYFDKEEITKEVLEDFYNHKLIDKKNEKTKSDIVVCTLGFIFDINYKEAFDLLIDTDNFGFYVSIVETSKESQIFLEELVKECDKYVEERLKC